MTNEFEKNISSIGKGEYKEYLKQGIVKYFLKSEDLEALSITEIINEIDITLKNKSDQFFSEQRNYQKMNKEIRNVFFAITNQLISLQEGKELVRNLERQLKKSNEKMISLIKQIKIGTLFLQNKINPILEVENSHMILHEKTMVLIKDFNNLNSVTKSTQKEENKSFHSKLLN
ncbi:hypothetical protein [Paenibacillus cremeus]|uniref:Uncharacterized protein n=1 Tax=Paenibacillus cremeus TaxID=2163881 RepID=A0A559K514_9BACL|nr:hypothetical protein [Paenibacillus cremeus]TVY07197.1 hypothetical protein FPZ49_25140 [Paenibacillus cremeus]